MLSISKGDICNTTRINLFTHNDTHLDAPKHFNSEGAPVDVISPEDFIFTNVTVVDLSPRIGEAIDTRDLKGIDPKSDLLLIYSGISDYWNSDPDKYVDKELQPWITEDAADYLINETDVKAVAVDFMCVDKIADLEKGYAPIHKKFCGLNLSKKPVLVYENVNVKDVLNEKIERVFAVPLLLEGMDGSPTTILVEIRNE